LGHKARLFPSFLSRADSAIGFPWRAAAGWRAIEMMHAIT
jgi:hypothetical protein